MALCDVMSHASEKKQKIPMEEFTFPSQTLIMTKKRKLPDPKQSNPSDILMNWKNNTKILLLIFKSVWSICVWKSQKNRSR